ncbi:MAG: DUF2442 domain-containing protein [Treponema sp.]|nr:DUF2442 domain-containing protein [Treponema sp.]
MFHKVESVEALPDFRLSVRFLAGPEKIYDMRPMMETHEAFMAFRLTRGLFEQAKVAAGGYGVYWNDGLDISCNELYANGKTASRIGL